MLLITENPSFVLGLDGRRVYIGPTWPSVEEMQLEIALRSQSFADQVFNLLDPAGTGKALHTRQVHMLPCDMGFSSRDLRPKFCHGTLGVLRKCRRESTLRHASRPRAGYIAPHSKESSGASRPYKTQNKTKVDFSEFLEHFDEVLTPAHRQVERATCII